MRWTITSRTIAGFLLMAGLFATVNFAMVLYINRVQAITKKIFDTNVSSLLSAQRMEGAIQAQRRRLSNFLLSGDAG